MASRLTWMWIAVLALGGARAVLAHNGAVALASPLDGVAVDGSLEDWPPTVAAHPMRLTAYGRPPRDARDLSAALRVGYAKGGEALLVALEVSDESPVADGSPQAGWDTEDGCEIYLSWGHDGQVGQYSFTVERTLRGAQAAVRSTAHGRVYEWRIPAPDRLRPGVVLGLDAALSDRDADGSFTWLTWGRGEQKRAVEGRLGDLVLVGEGQAFGVVEGQVQTAQGHLAAAAIVELQSATTGWQVRARADEAGRFAVELPAGAYRLHPWREGGDTVSCTVADGATARVRLALAGGPPPGQTSPGVPRRARAGPGRVRGAWKTLELLDGLPAVEIADLHADPEGSLWIGMQSGVARFDGFDFHVLDRDVGWPWPGVQSVLRDRAGHLWLGTGWLQRPGAGVVRWDGERLTAYGTADGLAHDSVICLLEDRHGTLWFGTFGGLTRFDGERFHTYTVEDGLGDNTVLDLLEDRAGTLWAATGYGRSGGVAGGLSRFDGERFATLTTDDGLPSNWIRGLHEAASGDLWIATLGGGVSRFDGKVFHNHGAADGLPSDRVWAFAETRDGALYLATGAGLCRYDGAGFKPLGTADGSRESVILDVEVDGDGLVWFATAQGTVGRYDPNVEILSELAGSPVTGIAAERSGALWFTAGREAARYEGGRLQTPSVEEGLARVPVLAIHEDRSGSLWFATDQGVTRLAGGRARTYDTSDGLASLRATAFFEDEQGHLWVATWGGASRFDGQGFQSLTAADGLPYPRVLGFAADGRWGVFIGTAGGLCRYREGRLESVSWSLPAGLVYPLLTDRSGRTWFRVDTGVAVSDGDSLRVFSSEHGLPGQVVESVFEDDQGIVWFGTEQGAARFDGGRFEPLAAPGEGTVPVSAICQVGEEIWFATRGRGVLRWDGTLVQQLMEADGLASNTVHDLAVDRDGNAWIATEGGVTRYRPRRSRPRLALDDVVTDRPLGAAERVRLSSTQPYLSSAFHGTSLVSGPGAMAYLHRLLPLEAGWRVTREGAAGYTDLPRGDYTFEVVAVDRDFGRSAPARVAVTVHLPYELVAWTSALSLAVLLTLLQGARVLHRDRRLRESNERLTQANRELSDQIERRERAESERAQLGTQVRDLRYLNRLRAVLESPRSADGVLADAGRVLAEALGSSTRARIQLEVDERTWSQVVGGDPDPAHRYERPIQWGERHRGRLVVECAVELGEGERRALLDETAGQVARALETRELTAQLLQSARLVALGQMAAGVAHELNQPLAAMATVAGDIHLRLLEGRAVAEEQLKEMMRDLMGLVQRMSGTIGHLRLFSRDASGQPGTEFSLNEVIRSSLKVVGTQLADHGVEVVADLQADLEPVFGQPFQLEQVFLNLLANARDAVDERSRDGRAAGKRIEVTTRRDGPTVRAEVRDNGVGIAAENLHRLFEPFFTTKPPDRGTGLGLSISYAIVRNHGGRITCQSRPGEGAAFRVELPVAAEGRV